MAMPWVELSLTDASGALLARRVFPPTALVPAVDRLGPEAEKAFSLPSRRARIGSRVTPWTCSSPERRRQVGRALKR